MVTDPTGSGPFSALAVDLGSSSIKVLRADISDAGELTARPTRSIAHQPVQRGGYLEWDIEALVLDVIRAESRDALAGRVAITLDGWGDGLVFLDRRGDRIGPLRCYRDGGLARGADLMLRRDLPEIVAERTGCTIGIDSTLAQLLAVLDERPSWLADIERVIPLVDYLGGLLTEQRDPATEVGLSPASTSGFINPRTGRVDRTLLDLLAIPPTWIPEPSAEMRAVGPIRGERLPPGVKGSLLKVAGHDTATALVGQPERAAGSLFVSLGSWAVVGVVVAPDRRSAAPFRTLAPVMHEATAEGDLRVNRNVPALRLVQLLEQEQLSRAATHEERRVLFPRPGVWERAPVLDVFALDVRRPLTDQVCSWGRSAGRATDTAEHRFREVFRGIAQAIAATVDEFAAAGIVRPDTAVWVCGGGVRVGTLLQWITDLTGRPIEVGPAAASAVGGVLGVASILGSGDYRDGTGRRLRDDVQSAR
jgi:rhamnulokinase